MALSVELLNKPLSLNVAQSVHFVGIGGIGMSGLAKVLLESGFQVSGSDVAENSYTQELQSIGARIHIGHAATHVPENALLIVSSSIDPSNPEIALALSQGLEIHHRSGLLREILQGDLLHHQKTIGITGTHGKTSITGMTGLAMEAAGLDPTIVVGGKMPRLKTNAVLGKKRLYGVAELDESDGTILQYQPSLSVIANLELDHADHYTDGLAGVMDTFRHYLAALKPGSKVLYNVTCPNTKQLSEAHPDHLESVLLAPRDIFTGQETETTYWLKNARNYGKGRYQAYVYRNSILLGELVMSVPGAHNLMNGLCAIAAGCEMGADFEVLAEEIRAFTGMGRRFETVGEVNNILLVDDYAHHPSEVLATLKAAKESLYNTGGRLIAVFQPHRYTRLQALWHEFKTCFDEADLLFLTDVYAAHESPIPNISSESLTEAVTHPQARYIPLIKEISLSGQPHNGFGLLREELRQVAKPGDIILSMGAGNVTHLLRHWSF